MTTITLKGEMGELFGGEWRFPTIKSAAEALRAINANVGGERIWRYLNDATARGVEFAFFINNRNIEKEGLRQAILPDSEIVVLPVPAGSKKQGLVSTIIGVIVVAVVAYFTWGAGAGSAAAAWFGAGSTTGSMLMGIGLSMTFSGVATMIAGQPKAPTPQESPTNQPSYIFNGPTNRTKQGNVYPVVYGTMLVGSQRVSAAIVNEDYSTPYWDDGGSSEGGFNGAPGYGENPYGSGPGPGASSGNNTGAVGYGGTSNYTYDPQPGYYNYTPNAPGDPGGNWGFLPSIG